MMASRQQRLIGWPRRVLIAALMPWLALGAASAKAQDAAPAADDPFAAFDEFDAAFEDEGSLPLSGFVEGAWGRRIAADPNGLPRQSLGELRARLETEWSNDALRLSGVGDALYDDYESDFEIELRELSLQLSPVRAVDLKLGRQVLTWGTGDLVFLNDLFPKSWVSFFAGRDDEYLKAPSDAVRTSWYNDVVNVDFVVAPEFDPDDYLTGERFSFFSPLAGGIVAPSPPLAVDAPSGRELAARLFRTIDSTEYAAYFYDGYFKRPLGLTPALAPDFPKLGVYGASLRRPLGQGLFNAEFAFHDSREDGDGSNPLVPNSQLRLLAGFEFEARARLTLGFQTYVERTLDYEQLIANSPTPAFEPDRTRVLLTNRFSWRSERDRLSLSLFTFYSPSDSDYYLRPVANYRQSDQWTFTAGANLFGGDQIHTFFGQLEDNSNLYLRVRFNY